MSLLVYQLQFERMTEPAPFPEFYHYVTAQLDKLNNSLLQVRQTIEQLQLTHNYINKQHKRIQDVQSRFRVMEVYQSQNFKNNQRLYQAHEHFDLLQRRVSLLESVSLQGQPVRVSQDQDHQLLLLSQKLHDLQAEISKIKQKNQAISRFKRQVSPQAYNQSTKDISFDKTNNLLQTKKMQKKLQEFLIGQLKNFQLRMMNGQPNDYQQPPEQTVTRNTRMKESASPSHKLDHRLNNDFQAYFSNKTEKGQDYYLIKNKATQTTHKKKPKEKSKSKSNSKRKSGHSISKQKISLHSVNQFLKIKSKKQ